MLPQIPLHGKLRTAFQQPIELEHDPERAWEAVLRRLLER